MAYCSRCGVEVEANRVQCPLCDTPIHCYDEETELSSLWPVQKELPKIRKRTKRILTLMPLLLFLVIAFLVVLIVDLRMTGSLGWSRYALTSLGTIFSVGIGIIIFWDIKILNLVWVTACVLMMLSLFDTFSGGTVWFTSTGVPLTLLTALYGELTLIGANFLGKKYGAQITLQSLLVTLLCFGIEYVLSTSGGTASFTWSLIVAAPLMLIFFTGVFSILVLKRYIDFDKYFHR